jgi:signal transduction histidine kinase
MKLLQKTNRYFLLVALVVFFVGGVLFFFLFQAIIENDLNTKLLERKKYVLHQMSNSDSLVFYQRYSADRLSIEISNGASNEAEVLSDTVIFDLMENKLIHYRQLTFTAPSKGKLYLVRVRRAFVEQSDLIKGVVLLEAMLFLGFVAVLTVLNNQLSKRLWRPFYRILDVLNGYKLDKSEPLRLKRNSVTEFDALATSIEEMTSKAHREFVAQKEFIENASHETQTPLAAIRNEMEVLLQSQGLSEKQVQAISSAAMAANRLAKLNEALLILSRIENRQFHVVEDISINNLIDRHVNNFEELLTMKNIRVNKLFQDRIETKMNIFLADMLIENLVTNAIKHNAGPGVIMIHTEGDELIVANTGDRPRTDTERMFERFVKSNPQSTSLGLGLPIVKAICDTYMLRVKYMYEDRFHRVSIHFNNVT